MEILQQPKSWGRRLGLLPGSFNPPTRAHLALARAALHKVDSVLLVIPRSFPHKQFTAASLEQRLEMMCRVTGSDDRLGVALSEGGLAIDMAREARDMLALEDIHVVCGRDAAERYISWDYGDPEAIHRILREVRLLVASRGGEFVAPEPLSHAIDRLSLDNMDEHSSTRLREAIERRAPEWRDLAPDEICDLIERIYG